MRACALAQHQGLRFQGDGFRQVGLSPRKQKPRRGAGVNAVCKPNTLLVWLAALLAALAALATLLPALTRLLLLLSGLLGAATLLTTTALSTLARLLILLTGLATFTALLSRIFVCHFRHSLCEEVRHQITFSRAACSGRFVGTSKGRI